MSNVTRMDMNEATATLEQLAREREALDGSYADLSAEMDRLTEAGGPPEDIGERYQQLLTHFRRLANYLEMERGISRRTFGLLMDAYQRLEKATRD